METLLYQPLHTNVPFAGKPVEYEQGKNRGNCKDGGVRGCIAVVAADNLRIDGDGKCLGAIGIQNN